MLMSAELMAEAGDIFEFWARRPSSDRAPSTALTFLAGNCVLFRVAA